MKIRLSLIVVSIFLLTCTTAFAQTSSEIDSHIAAAKAAAAQNFRDTFVNLCLPGAAPGGAARGGPPRGAGAPAAAPATPDRAGWYASPYKVFDNL
jgi:hypothetical protein